MSLTSASSRIFPLDRDGDEVLHAFGRQPGKVRGHDRRADDDDRVFPLGKIGIERQADNEQGGHDHDGEPRPCQAKARQEIHGSYSGSGRSFTFCPSVR